MCTPSFIACSSRRSRLACGPMRRRARDPITRLQTAIDCLPERTRRAMLDGVRAQHDRRRRLHRRPRRHLPDAGRAPQRRAHELALLRPRVGRVRARRSACARPRARELRVLEDLLVASLAEDLEGALRPGGRDRRAQGVGRALAADGDHRPPAAQRRSALRRSIAEPIHQPQQVQRRERLREEEVGAGVAGRSRSASSLGVAGQHHDRRVGRRRARDAAAGRSRSRSAAACRCPGRRSTGCASRARSTASSPSPASCSR